MSMRKRIFLPAKNVDIGFAARKIISAVQAKQKVSNYCLVFLQSLATKPLERYPLQYPVVRYLLSLDLRFMVSNPNWAIRKMTLLLKSDNFKAKKCWWLWYHSQAIQNIPKWNWETFRKRIFCIQTHRRKYWCFPILIHGKETKISGAVGNDTTSLDIVTWPASGGERFFCKQKCSFN